MLSERNVKAIDAVLPDHTAACNTFCDTYLSRDDAYLGTSFCDRRAILIYESHTFTVKKYNNIYERTYAYWY